MHTLTPEAEQLFARYLTNVRWSLRGIAGADEIEHNVREHVDSALESQDEPVSSRTLREVLSRLGEPWEWVPLEELPFWRRTLMRFSLGPEDWRLAYLCFGFTILGLLLVPIGVGVVLLIGAYVLARATCDLASDRESGLGPRRWLVYPPLILASVLLGAAMLFGPASAASAAGVGEGGYAALLQPFAVRTAVGSIRWNAAGVALSFGLWWIIAAALGVWMVRPLRAALFPIGAGLRRVHFAWLATAGVILVATGAALLFA